MITVLLCIIAIALLPAAIGIAINLLLMLFIAVVAPVVWVIKQIEAQASDFKKAYDPLKDPPRRGEE